MAPVKHVRTSMPSPSNTVNKFMKRLLYIFLLFSILVSCSDEEQTSLLQGEGTLVLTDLCRKEVVKSVVKTRNVIDPDLALEILTSDNAVYRDYQYAAGATLPDDVKDKFSLIPGNYTLHAYTENRTSWATDNEGRGSGVYEVREAFAVQADWVTYLNVEVPLINYGVTYSVPEGFSDWFPTCAFTVAGDGRTCPLTADQIAYFDPANVAGFTFNIHLVNTDGETYDIEPHTYPNPQAGLVYDVSLSFASADDPTKLKIGISYDDTYEEIVHEITLY